MNDAYIHRYAHCWDRKLHVQLGVNLFVLWAQLSMYIANRSQYELFVGFLLLEPE